MRSALKIAGFELRYQACRVATWCYAGVLFAVTFVLAAELAPDYARMDRSLANGPFILAVMTLYCSTLGLLIGAAVAGEAGARDAATRIEPLVHTTPVNKAAYVGGRFLAAFGLYGAISCAVPLALLLVAALSGGQSDLVGPFRPAAYLGPFLVILLPNAFVATVVMFSLAATSRRAVAAYLGGVLLLVACAFSWGYLAQSAGQWPLAKLLDPLGATVLDELSRVWTPADRSSRLIAVEGWLLWNRVLWMGLALGVLAVTHRWSAFAHHEVGASRRDRRSPERVPLFAAVTVTAAPGVRPTFGVRTRMRQLAAFTWDSFRKLTTRWGSVALVATAAFLVLSGLPLQHLGTPLVATTERMLAFLAASLTRLDEINGIVVPLLIVYCAGELIWRERETRLSEIADAAPVPNWVLFAGKFVGLCLVLALLQALITAAGMLTQVFLGRRELEPGLYLRALFGLQFVDWMLFSLLALVVHTLVNQKYLGHLAAVLIYLFMVLSASLGVSHHLLVYASDPGWIYSDMRGFGPFVGPWLAFKAYWAAWALLLSVVAIVAWVRGTETGLRSRLALARRRLGRPAAGAALAAVALVLATGGFVFYNTNVLNAYKTPVEGLASRAEYERRYGQFRDLPQPQVAAVTLRVEIYPRRRMAEIHGVFDLVNRTAAPIATIHVATKPGVRTSAARFNRPAQAVVSDDELGHRVYALGTPLALGASLQLRFDVQFDPRGFPNAALDTAIVGNGSHITNDAWLPAIGYQPDRELTGAAARRARGLAARPEVPHLDDDRRRHDAGRAARIMLEVVVGTDADQIALAPGRLRRTWTAGGRRYFDYATDAPIRNDYAVFSAAYAVRDARWHDVAIQILHHPAHARNIDRLVRSVQASLGHYTRQFGPYPYRQIRLVERPGGAVVLHASPINIWYEESFSLLDPDGDTRGIDLPFAVVAHEVAHQWWGGTLVPAEVEGAALLTESLAWYSAFGVVEESSGGEQLRRLLDMMRQIYVTPRTRASVPLLRANDWLLAYRKGPFALYAIREYIGADRVTAALRRLLERHASGAPALPTSLDLYRELQAVTPAELRPLLADLFEANTYWELSARAVTAEPTASGQWQVTLDVSARKVVVDPAGAETDVPMNDLVEIGVYADASGRGVDDALYLHRHRIRSGDQRVTVTVPSRPARAGIDPRRLLIDVKGDDNVKEL